MIPKTKKKIGEEGEIKAAEYLRGAGYVVIDRNFRARHGEIDIVCRKDDVIVFAEIKNYSTYDASSMEYALNSTKKQRIIQTSKRYLYEKGIDEETTVRYDVVFVHNGRVEHFKNAFSEGGIP